MAARPLSTIGARGSFVTVVVLGALVGAAGTAPGSTLAPAAAPYSLRATTQCLERRGAAVARVRPLDSSLRALRDLSQRTSREARFGQQSISLAFAKSDTGAALLVELLRRPRDPYRFDRRRNVVLMYRPGTRAALADVVACLRS